MLLFTALRSATAGADSTWWCMYAAGGDLWQTTGDAPVRLTTDGHLTQPAAGAQMLAYVERERNYSDIWVASADSTPRPLTHNASALVAQNRWAAQPTLERDGRQAYTLADFDKQSTGSGDLAIWELDVQRGSFRQITHPPAYAGGDQDVTVNPRDPSQIVFTRYQYGDDGQLIESLDWLDVRAGTAIPLAGADRAMRQAAFSADGVQLAFVQADGAAENLYVAQLETVGGRPQLTGIRQVATGVIAHPVWRPDGLAIAYLALTHGRFQLWTVARNQGSGVDPGAPGQPRQLTNGPDLDATSRPVWLTDTDAAKTRQWLQVAPAP